MRGSAPEMPPLSRRSMAAQRSQGVAVDPATEDDLDILRAAEVKVVSDQTSRKPESPCAHTRATDPRQAGSA
jgi:hypothetical protein